MIGQLTQSCRCRSSHLTIAIELATQTRKKYYRQPQLTRQIKQLSLSTRRVNKRALQWVLIIQKHIKTHHTNQHLLTNTLCSTDFICGAELICILMTNADKCTDLLRA